VASKACRVTISDMQGIEHTAQVLADTLYEAVALGLVAIQASSWSNDLTEGSVKVTIHDTPVEHTVNLRKFKEWLGRAAGAPRDTTARQRVREILADNMK
jgi:hypothetical protein